jgi:hypothetical protein
MIFYNQQIAKTTPSGNFLDQPIQEVKGNKQ